MIIESGVILHGMSFAYFYISELFSSRKSLNDFIANMVHLPHNRIHNCEKY
jgi:hypothetical protein